MSRKNAIKKHIPSKYRSSSLNVISIFAEIPMATVYEQKCE